MAKMNREEILETSRQEYAIKRTDEGQVEFKNRANQTGISAFTLAAVAIVIFNLYHGKDSWEIIGLLQIVYATENYAKYLYTREKQDLILLVLYVIVAILAFVAYVRVTLR